jgi:hypothetical protein
MSHLLVAPLLSRLTCFSGLSLEQRNRIPHSVVPMALFGIVSQMGSALCLAVLAKLVGLTLLWDSQFTGASRDGMLLGTSLGGSGSS